MLAYRIGSACSDTNLTCLLASARRSLKELATPLRQAPFTRTQLPGVDANLLAHIQAHVRVWNADAASDEQLAAHESMVEAAHTRPLFANLEFINRDVAHSSRRLDTSTAHRKLTHLRVGTLPTHPTSHRTLPTDPPLVILCLSCQGGEAALVL